MMKFPKTSLLILLFLTCIPSNGYGQFKIPEPPKEQTSVYDYVRLLSSNQKNLLEEKLIRYSDSTSTQIVIVIISSTEGENINFLGAQWGEKWGIGQAEKDNGILILLAKDDRKLAISTGYGTEGALTDALSKRIIESIIIPKFKQGDYYSGLNVGADAIFKALKGEFTEERSFDSSVHSIFSILGIIFTIGLVLFGIFILYKVLFKGNDHDNNDGKGTKKKEASIWDTIILTNMGRGDFGGGSSSSGSFGGGGFSGGFGGGSFGGGGSSGSW